MMLPLKKVMEYFGNSMFFATVDPPGCVVLVESDFVGDLSSRLSSRGPSLFPKPRKLEIYLN